MFRGSLVALVTPMTESGDVDQVAFSRLLDWHAREGSDGVVVGGTTGESATLSAAESAELLQIAVQRLGGKLPVIAGTGGSFNIDTNKLLAQTLHQEGFHVLGFPSPTHPNFIVNASETGVPGRMADDARDLYRAMRMAHERVKDRIEVSEVYLAGYSLGGTHAAWVAKLDERVHRRGYGQKLLRALPTARRSTELDQVRDFWARSEAP